MRKEINTDQNQPATWIRTPCIYSEPLSKAAGW